MSVTDGDLAQACLGTYTGATQTWGTGVVHCYLSQINGVHVLAWEGTQSAEEWAIDFDADVVDHPVLGDVHDGWLKDVLLIQDQLEAYVSTLAGPLATTGHSKGAAECLISTALMVAKGIRVARCSTFGTPRPGLLNGLVTDALGRDYDNGKDLVPDVPRYLPHPRSITRINVAPAANDPWGPLRWHHMSLYAQGALAT